MKHFLTIVALIMSLPVAAQKMPEIISNIPDEVKNYASKIKDNGKSLDREEFTMDSATVKGTFYGLDTRIFDGNPEFAVAINNPFTQQQEVYTSKIDGNNSYEIKVPMTVRHQTVSLLMQSWIMESIVLTAGKTVVVDYDFAQIKEMQSKSEPDFTPYFSGENVDLNYALNTRWVNDFNFSAVYNDEALIKISNFSAAQYKEYFLNAYNDFCNRVDTMKATKRAKELLKLVYKSQTAYFLSMGEGFIEDGYRKAHGKERREPIPDFKSPVFDETYYDYPQLLDLDDAMMFYTDQFGSNIYSWAAAVERMYYKTKIVDLDEFAVQLAVQVYENLDVEEQEKPIVASVVQKLRSKSNEWTDEEIAFGNKYANVLQEQLTAGVQQRKQIIKNGVTELAEKIFVGESYFKDFIKLQDICSNYEKQSFVPDSLVREVEKMRFPFYAEYIKKKNVVLLAQKEAEKLRGGYFAHKVGDSEGDSLLVEILKDFKGKVVLIDFWNTWCGPCRWALQQMRPMEDSYIGKDVVFLFVADTSSPEKQYTNMIPTMKGHHYRLTERQVQSLKFKWGFTGIPSYVIVGKDGLVKDYHTGFKGVEYYRAKIEAELTSPTPSSN